MFVSVDPALVKRDALESRSLIESQWYQDRWGDLVKIKTGLDIADGSLEYYTTQGGLRFGTSLAAKGIGWHVHTQVGDDLIKPTECSPAACARSRLAWSDTFAGRIAHPREHFARVLLQQRLSPLDMIGYAVDQDYAQLILPMTYDPERYSLPDDDPRRLRRGPLWDGVRGGDRRTTPGDPLCPERVSAEEIERLRKEKGASYLLQDEQDPTASTDRVWDAEKLRAQRYAALPPGGRYTWDWDLSSKGREQRATKQGSWTVGWCWYETPTASYLVEEIRHEGDYKEQRASVRDGWKRHRGKVYLEDKANGPAIQADLRVEIGAELDMVGVDRDKLSRATAAAPYQDRVYLPRAPWVDGLLAELDRFPGRPDDRSDVLSQHLARRWLPKADPKKAAQDAYAKKLAGRRRR
jgi:predicted phage terminase large subunit-like protein